MSRSQSSSSSNEVWREKLAEKLDLVLTKVGTIEGKLEGLPNRVQILETMATRLDTTVTTMVGSATRHELRTDKIEERLRDAEDQLTTLKGERRGINWMLEFLKVGGAGGVGAAMVKFLGGPS
ncbi:hypothetical protein [Rhizobium sp. Nf11,1]|uniref:hypothetical protein n=1 Tax=Rhizobium sp. Nf11,1 TaxID=3404923 RepID=UPI003D334307